MILLITHPALGQECAAALTASTRIETEIAREVSTALVRLREQEFDAVVIDESLLDPSAKTFDMVVKYSGRAVPIYLNLAVCRKERVVRDVQGALRRAEQERQLARHAAEFDLRGQLRDALTGILLSTQQALETPSLPSAAEAKLQVVCQMADKIRERLGIAA
jgi:hypothetical protein